MALGLRLRKQLVLRITTDKKISRDKRRHHEDEQEEEEEEQRIGIGMGSLPSPRRGKMVPATPTSIWWNINYATNKQRPVQLKKIQKAQGEADEKHFVLGNRLAQRKNHRSLFRYWFLNCDSN